MMTEEQIEKAFGKWLATNKDTDQRYGAFRAGIALLMPVIEKLQESNDRVENILVCSSIADHAELIDGAYEIITETQQQVREMLENLTGEGK